MYVCVCACLCHYYPHFLTVQEAEVFFFLSVLFSRLCPHSPCFFLYLYLFINFAFPFVFQQQFYATDVLSIHNEVFARAFCARDNETRDSFNLFYPTRFLASPFITFIHFAVYSHGIVNERENIRPSLLPLRVYALCCTLDLIL